ncbi:MAG: SUMF1/EgtB/PvdO family nonheme iron enzyme, partial [Anaerolinea sp.]|nr:SUMF1/EgtB/PvdO family nonheme iron enzyme [Anaerolinea sp.]
ALAYGMQDGRAANEAAQVRIPEETAHSLLDHPLAAEIVAAGIQLNVLDKDLTRLEITYLHQLLQEYFAARVLARRPEARRVQTAWRSDEMPERLSDWLKTANVSDPLPAAPTTGWEETTLLAAAMTANQEQFVTDLMAANLPLAARCAAAPDVPVSAALRQRIQQSLLTRLADEASDLRVRMAMAEVLTDLGDPRLTRRSGAHGDYLLPPLAAIPGGKYTIGTDNSQYDRERPAHQVTIAPFEMAVFPVTNAEYALFIAAGGYEDERWWETKAARAWLRGKSGNEGIKQGAQEQQQVLQDFSDEVIRAQQASPEQIRFWLWLKHVSAEDLEQQYEKWYPSGKTYRQPEYWEDSRFNHPSRPVVGVTWFEARAYCAWLSAQSGDSYRLPTEVQWEAAARGQAGREYAYGERYDAARCNTFETHIQRTTPVGVFPGGRTPEGIYDLSGNVWEWTSTMWGKRRNEPDYPYPYEWEDGREDLEDGTSWRVLRGGAFYGDADFARAAYRVYIVPGNRSNGYGFRVVVVRPPSHHPDHCSLFPAGEW